MEIINMVHGIHDLKKYSKFADASIQYMNYMLQNVKDLLPLVKWNNDGCWGISNLVVSNDLDLTKIKITTRLRFD